jgi:ABC-2 type transport system permease protein
MPTTWAAEVLIPLLGAREGEPLFHLALLASTAADALLGERRRSSSGSSRRRGRAQRKGRVLLARIGRCRAGSAPSPAPLPRTTGILVAKDLARLLRDASQWSQLLRSSRHRPIYVFNFSVLPSGDDTALGIVLATVAAFCNLGLAAFVTTAVAVRFVYPMVSLEGRSWWILRSAPLALQRVWWSKFWLGFVPLVLLGEILVAATNHYPRRDPWLDAGLRG